MNTAAQFKIESQYVEWVLQAKIIEELMEDLNKQAVYPNRLSFGQ